MRGRATVPSRGERRSLRAGGITGMLTKPRSPVLAYAPAAVWAGCLLYLGNRPFYDPLPQIPPLPLDKIAHLVLYGGLGLLAVLGWRWAGRRPWIVVPLAAALSIGIIDEIHQRSVATRSSDFFDWLTDAVAILIAFTLLGRRNRRPDDE
jgi:VanZ family protein